MSARDTILAKVRRSLAVSGDEAARRAAVAERLSDAKAGVIPARGQLPQDERIALFSKYAEKYGATIARVASIEDLPQEVSRYLKSSNLPASVRMGDDVLLKSAGFEREPMLTVLSGASDGTDLAGVSHARGAVAESGTLVLASGPDNPVTINFLPEHHIVAVRAEDIGASLEEAFAGIAATYGKGEMPRTVNFVTGPSRSGDIEQKIIMGAHGPRALHIVIVG
ncbi:LutC/YkgG family protein [Rhizobium sp. C4]|uniref:LutC/YkgG family protein n=1 Tax=Rhizobium sp. C4 TaxID=1349800 RepID=UPI001E3DDACE|nr:lactate utilization protein [Rhizobium sp. C4]MCD2172835.1 lactate utilization protein [Rhizobium sp. C4]